MSVNLEKVLKSIQEDKDKNLKPENIRYGTSCLGVKGTLKPVTLTGGDTATSIYLQDETPIDPNGIWINTDKTYENIYLENEKHTTEYSALFSDDTTDTGDESNIIRNIVAPVSLQGSTYCQQGNIVHFFGYYNTYSTSSNVSPIINQHYMYNFNTNTWTKLSDCPTPQGFGGAVWINDDIYIIGTAYTDYYNYMYKYNVTTDTWTELEKITISNYKPNFPILATYDGESLIYFACESHMFSYNITTAEIRYIGRTGCGPSNGGSASPNNVFEVAYGGGYNYRGVFIYYNGGLYMGSSSGGAYIGVYNISTGLYYRASTSQYAYMRDVILVDDKIYYKYIDSYGAHSSVSTYKIFNLTSKTDTSIYSNNSFRSELSKLDCPIVHFNTVDGDLIFSFVDASYTSAIKLQDKSYDLDSNTLMIYCNTLGQGKYSTELFKNDKVLNAGRIITQFNDVNLYDKSQEKLIKNLSTYYGNGTDWIKIK